MLYFTWDEFFQSNKSHPLCSFKATDLDVNDDESLIYELENISSSTSMSLLNLIEINKFTSDIYFNFPNSNIFSPPTNDSSSSSSYITFTIVARDDSNSLHTRLNVKLVMSVYANIFEQTYYHFAILESIETRRVFGRVKARTESIYSIEKGFAAAGFTYFDQFEINYITGEITARISLDYETTRTYFLIVRADTNSLYSSTCLVRIDLIDVNDNRPQFEQYVYVVSLNENTPKMTRLFELNAIDLDKPNTPNSQVRYKLLNEFDRFYVNELTGHVYNKISFDYEENESENDHAVQNKINLFQLNVMAYDLGDYPIKSVVSLNTTCVLNVIIANVNDVAPQFEKSVYFSNVEIDEDDLNEMSSLFPMNKLLLDESVSVASNRTHAFVSKVNAKDMDSTKLVYSIDEMINSHSIFKHSLGMILSRLTKFTFLLVAVY
jgi:hypothetical protein